MANSLLEPGTDRRTGEEPSGTPHRTATDETARHERAPHETPHETAPHRRPRQRWAPHPAQSRRSRAARRLRWAGAATLLILIAAGADRMVDLVPSLSNPFAQQTVDRSTPPLLLALADLNEYHAATGTFQVVVDLERDTPYVPSVISGERTTFLATGTVDSYVDFAGIGADNVTMSADRRSVTITLPRPQLGEATIDHDESRVLDRDRGVLDRLADAVEENPGNETELHAIAERKLTASATQSDLVTRAEDNTRSMLTALATSLGFQQVTVEFEGS